MNNTKKTAPNFLYDATELFFDNFSGSTTDNTIRVYRIAIDRFYSLFKKMGKDQNEILLSDLRPSLISDYIDSLSGLSDSSIILYSFVVISLFTFLIENYQIEVSIDEIKQLRKEKLPQKIGEKQSDDLLFEISQLVELSKYVDVNTSNDPKTNLRILRNRALLLTLTDTGLEIQILCALKRTSIDWKKNSLNLPLKISERTIPIPLTNRALEAIKSYLKYRESYDKDQVSYANLPVFSRHDRGSGSKILPITPATARNIINRFVIDFLGVDYVGKITPRKLRKYTFEQTLYDNINYLHPQIVKRCQILFGKGLYDEAIFNAMLSVEDSLRQKINGDQLEIGKSLIVNALHTEKGKLKSSDNDVEQEANFHLFLGAIGSFKNPRSHRFMNSLDPINTFEYLCLGSILLRLIDSAKSKANF